jgi:hypothetical protein
VRPPRERPSASTVSGFAKRAVYRELDAAIGAGTDVTRACCLAAELLATPGERAALAMHLTDLYAEGYVSVDVGALARVAGALGALARGEADEQQQQQQQQQQRRAMCVAVTALSVGLSRERVAEQIMLSARRALGGTGGAEGQATATASTSAATATAAAAAQARAHALAALVSAGRCADAVLAAHALLDEDGSPAAVRGVWDACGAGRSGEDGHAAQFVAHAHALYHLNVAAAASPNATANANTTPPKTTRTRRKALALCAVLVATSAAADSSAPAPPSTWRGALADVAIERACVAVDRFFDQLPQGQSTAAAAAPPPPTPSPPAPPPPPPTLPILSPPAPMPTIPCDAAPPAAWGTIGTLVPPLPPATAIRWDLLSSPANPAPARMDRVPTPPVTAAYTADPEAAKTERTVDVSYLRLYTRYDHGAAAKVHAARRASLLDAAEAPLTKTVRITS